MRKGGEQKGWGWIDRGGEIARVVEQMAGNGGNGEVGDKKRTDERDGQGKQSCEKHQYKKMNKRAGRGKGGGRTGETWREKNGSKLCRGCRNIRFSSAGVGALSPANQATEGRNPGEINNA